MTSPAQASGPVDEPLVDDPEPPVWLEDPLYCRNKTHQRAVGFSSSMLTRKAKTIILDSTNSTERMLCDSGLGFCAWWAFVHARCSPVEVCPYKNGPLCYCQRCPYCGGRDPFDADSDRRNIVHQPCLQPCYDKELRNFLETHSPKFVSPQKTEIYEATPRDWSYEFPVFGIMNVLKFLPIIWPNRAPPQPSQIVHSDVTGVSGDSIDEETKP